MQTQQAGFAVLNSEWFKSYKPGKKVRMEIKDVPGYPLRREMISSKFKILIFVHKLFKLLSKEIY